MISMGRRNSRNRPVQRFHDGFRVTRSNRSNRSERYAPFQSSERFNGSIVQKFKEGSERELPTFKNSRDVEMRCQRRFRLSAVISDNLLAGEVLDHYLTHLL